MKKLILIILCLSLAGCIATRLIVIEMDKEGKVIRYINAEDYSITSPSVTAVPSRWLTPDFVGEVFKGATSIIGVWPKPTIPSIVPVNPTPVPVTPTPVTPVNPGPYPAPVNPTPPPTPTPPPSPTPPPTASSVFSVQGNLITLDLDTLPGSMRAVGFDGCDNSLYYVMAYIYNYGPGEGLPDDGAGSNAWAQSASKQKEIHSWFDGEVLKVVAQMKANPSLQLIAITNDGRDRCGFRLGPPIVSRVVDSGISASRVQVGKTLSPEEY